MSAVDTGLYICMFTGHVRALRPELEETEMNFKCISINWCNILSISDCIRFRSHCWSDASYASVLKPQASGPIGPRWTICRTVLFLDPNKGQQTSNDNNRFRLQAVPFGCSNRWVLLIMSPAPAWP